MNDPNSYAPGAAWQRPQDLVGTILADRYRVTRVLGEGGMGSVFAAEHVTLRKKVAIKVLHSELCRDQMQVDRFLQEARAASMIGHENIVDIVDFGPVPGGSVFFAMEYLEGEDLADLLRREGRLGWPRARELMLQILRALRAAHAKGIIHRDLKPANCFLVRRSDGRDFVKLLDFGIAKVTDPEGGESGGLTRTGAVFGTAKYMAPEQACGEPADQRTDVYAAAICLYEFLTGQVPFDGDNFMRVLSRHLTEPLTMPSTMAPDANISPAVESIIVKALSKKPIDRYQTMAEFEAAIAAIGPDGNLIGQFYEGPPRIAQQPEGKGGTLWLNMAGPGPASQPPEGRGGTLLLDPNNPQGFDQEYGTVKLPPNEWSGQHSQPSQPPPMMHQQHQQPQMLHGQPPMGYAQQGAPHRPISHAPSGGMALQTDPGAPNTRPPTRPADSTGDYTMFATEQRSPAKFAALLGLGAVAAIGGGLLVAWLVLSEDEPKEPEKSEPTAAVVEKKDEPEAKPEKSPNVAPEPVIPEPEEKPEPVDPVPVKPEPEPDPVKPEPVPETPSKPDKPINKPRPPKEDKIKDVLGPADWTKGFSKAKKAANACEGWLPGMRITVNATVGADGNVLTARPEGSKGPTPTCVANAVKNNAKFPKNKAGISSNKFTYTKE